MARLLTNRDYLRLIQTDSLNQVTESNNQVLLDAEQSAQVEMIGYLVQRYNTAQVFTDTAVFSFLATYNSKNLIYLDAVAYSAASTYILNTMVLQAGNVYYCSTAIPVAEAFNIAHWTLLGAQYAFFNVKLPFAEYDPKTTYVPGNQIWYNNSVYTCLISCTNVAPTVAAFWGTGTPYSISSVWPTDATKWNSGDNRNPFLVTHLINIVLYWLHHRINPKLIPDHRKEAYDGNVGSQIGGAIGWLKNVGAGLVTADLPNISPQQGVSISYGVAEGLNSDGTYSRSKNMLW